MAYVFGEVWPLLIAALVIGFAAGWLLRGVRVGDREAEHAQELEARDARVAHLEAHVAELGDLGDDLAVARGRIVHLEGETAEVPGLRDRIGALEAEVAAAGALRAEIERLQPRADLAGRLEAEVADLEERNTELESFRTRFVAADREAAEMRARIEALTDEGRVAALQAQVADLESAGREHDALRGRVVELERALRAAQDGGGGKLGEVQRELDRMNTRHREEVALLAAARRESDELRRRLAALEGAPAGGQTAMAFAAAPAEPEGPPLDLHLAARVLGVRVRMDDLTMVEGIGPKIGRLCREDGIGTWRALSQAPVERLRGILDAAGPAFRMHDPETWPGQAALLADGRWEDFKALSAELRAGRR